MLENAYGFQRMEDLFWISYGFEVLHERTLQNFVIFQEQVIHLKVLAVLSIVLELSSNIAKFV